MLNLWSPPFTPPSTLWRWPTSLADAGTAAHILGGVMYRNSDLYFGSPPTSAPWPENGPAFVDIAAPGHPDAVLRLFDDHTGVVLHGAQANPSIVRLMPTLTPAQTIQAAGEIMAGLSPWTGTIAQFGGHFDPPSPGKRDRGHLGTYWANIQSTAEGLDIDPIIHTLIPGLWGPFLAEHCLQGEDDEGTLYITFEVLGCAITPQGRLTPPKVSITSRADHPPLTAWLNALGPALLRQAQNGGDIIPFIGQRAYTAQGATVRRMHPGTVCYRLITRPTLLRASAHLSMQAHILARSLGLPEVLTP